MSVAALGALTLRSSHAQPAATPLDARIRQALGNFEQWVRRERASLSALVVQVTTGREIASVTPDEAVNPASNQKLLTAAAALDLLGPEHRFTTVLAGRRGGTGLSEIVLRSDGDPELSSADLSDMADSLVTRGHRRIDGDVLVDQSAFDEAWEPPGYAQRPNDWAAYRSPVSAVAVDRNAVTLYVAPDEPGKPARVWFEPAGLVTVSGVVQTGDRGSAQNVRLTVRPKNERMEGLVGGSVPPGRRVLSFSRRLASPELAAGFVLADKLRSRGVVVGGAVRAGSLEEADDLVVRRSRPLAQIVHALGKHSDNFTAEMLLKALGRRHGGGAPGSSRAGALAIEAYLRRQGALTPGTRIGNGSGLYDANRLSARCVCRVLTSVYADPRVFPELLASLAIGGVDGTLASRFTALRDSRRLRAKTGTLAAVTALSGYVLGPSALGPVAFSLMVNGIAGKHAEARRHIDAVVAAIAS